MRSLLNLIELLDRYRSGAIIDPVEIDNLLKSSRDYRKLMRPPLSDGSLIKLMERTKKYVEENPSIRRLRGIYWIGKILSTLGIFMTIFPLVAFIVLEGYPYQSVILGVMIAGIIELNVGYSLMLYVKRRYYRILSEIYSIESVDDRVKRYINYLISLLIKLYKKGKVSRKELVLSLLNIDYEKIKVIGRRGKLFMVLISV